MKRFFLLFGICISAVLSAQDLHYSQYNFAPLFTNIAHTGLFNGEYRVHANLRDQWFSVPVPYLTFSTGFDTQLMQEKLGDHVLGIGGLFHYDRAGDVRLSLTSVLLNASYHQRLSNDWFLGAGLQAGFGQRRFRRDLATFDDQFQGDVFNAAYVSADLANLNRSQYMYLDLGAGANLRYQQSKRSWANLGLNFAHLNMPAQGFIQPQAIRLPIRSSISLSSSVQLHPKWDLLPTMLWQNQGPYQEYLLGSLARYHLNLNPGRETAFFFGSKYRWADAAIVILGINYQSWQLGISYDVNFSQFQAATNRNGGFELSLIYIHRKVDALPDVKICPIL